MESRSDLRLSGLSSQMKFVGKKKKSNFLTNYTFREYASLCATFFHVF